MNRAYYIQWEESERGWGVRPDGYSLHLTAEDALIHKLKVLKQQADYYKGKGPNYVPDEYTRVGSEGEIMVPDEIYAKLEKERTVNYPGSIAKCDMLKQ